MRLTLSLVVGLVFSCALTACGGSSTPGIGSSQSTQSPVLQGLNSLRTNNEADRPPSSYPIFSQLFTAPNNPFHMTVSELKARGAVLQSQTLMNNLWSQGSYFESEDATPLYLGQEGESSYTFSCYYYNSHGCNAQGKSVHLPRGAYPQNGVDHHLTSVDLAAGGEFDGWGGAGYSQSCNPNGSGVICSWGGFFPFKGKGLENNGSTANHAGYAFGLFAVTAQELLNKRINHALGWNVACLDNPTVYPAATATGSDYPCSGGHGASPSARYGQLIHLKWSTGQIDSSAYSQPCKTILTAMADFGVYTYDDGNSGIQLLAENPQTYANPNPWTGTIYPQIVAAGDGTGSGSSFAWRSCLNRLAASDFEIFNIPNLGY